jgi:F0F1-type ATP synthase assembly protein I
MTKTTAPGKTPSPAGTAKPHSTVGEQTKSPTAVFIGAALDMSWRLAIVVLVPIIGGFELDSHFNEGPLFSILGFVLAAGGMFVVLKQMLQEVSRIPVPKKEQHS